MPNCWPDLILFAAEAIVGGETLLSELRIVNLALIDRQVLKFTPGLNVLTGETGAGKSIIIGSINLVLGMRASADLIRTGADEAYVEATFLVDPDSPAWRVVEQFELEGDNPHEITLSREISRSGRNVCRVNGIRTTLAQLRQIGDLLVDLHGQYEHQSLLKRSVQRDLLDSFAGGNVSALLEEISQLHSKYDRLTRKKAYLESSERERAQRLDLLRFQLNEIDSARLRPGEDVLLEEEQHRLENIESVRTTYERSYYELYEGANGQEALASRLESIAEDLARVARIDRKAQPVCDQFREAAIIIRELSRDIRSLVDQCEVDPQRLSEVTARLNLINSLKRKYGPGLEDVVAYRDKAAKELAELQKSEIELADIDSDIEKTAALLVQNAKALSHIRESEAKRLSALVTENLRDLALSRARFTVEVSKRICEHGFDVDGTKVEIGPTGMDSVEMMFSANEGEPLKPLASVASGGEISRIMLAIKAVLADCDRIPVIVFDEIDVGIGGATAHAVARKMRQISSSKQIICVTHLPQIASVADSHHCIVKNVVDGKTYTTVVQLNTQQREAELARMLDGEITDISIAHAREMMGAVGRGEKTQ